MSYGKTTGWPQAVESRFLEAMHATARQRELLEGAPYAGEIEERWGKMRGYRMTLPGGTEIYAVEHFGPWTGCLELSLVLRDGATGRVAERAHSMPQKWSSVGKDGPTAWWADLEGDGSLELGLERSYHNGTADNGKFVRWFRVTEELELELVHVSPLRDDVSVVSRGEQGVVRTRLLRSAEGELIHDQWFENPSYGVAPRAVGRPPTGKAAERRGYE